MGWFSKSKGEIEVESRLKEDLVRSEKLEHEHAMAYDELVKAITQIQKMNPVWEVEEAHRKTYGNVNYLDYKINYNNPAGFSVYLKGYEYDNDGTRSQLHNILVYQGESPEKQVVTKIYEKTFSSYLSDAYPSLYKGWKYLGEYVCSILAPHLEQERSNVEAVKQEQLEAKAKFWEE